MNRHQEALALVSGHDYYEEGWRNCADWFLSLTPERFEALKKERGQG